MNLGRFLILCSTVLTAFALSDEEEWAKFKLSYKRSYITEAEESLRFEIFKENLQKIRENNEQYQRKETTYKLAINKFADVSEEEFKDNLKSSFDPNSLIRTANVEELSDIGPVNLGKVRVKKPVNLGKVRDIGSVNLGEVRDIEPDCFDTDDPVPDSINWSEQGAVTPIKDEKTFYDGYSWAFAVAAAFEAQVYLAIGALLDLSAQQVMDCVDPTDNKTYFGGKLDFVYNYFLSHGILTEDEYPYSGSIGNCQDDQPGIDLGLLIDLSEECQIKQAVGLDGPVTVMMDASKLANYAGGIIDSTMCSNAEEDLNHSVLIVGYDLEPYVGYYWLIKNSWGVDWGEEGYLRIFRMKNNTCGVGHSPAYPYILRDIDGRNVKDNERVFVNDN